CQAWVGPPQNDSDMIRAGSFLVGPVPAVAGHGLVEPPRVGVGLRVDDTDAAERGPTVADHLVHLGLESLGVLGFDDAVVHRILPLESPGPYGPGLSLAA